MASFYAQSMQSQAPLTPPGSGAYNYRSCNSMPYAQEPYVPHQPAALGPLRHDSVYDYTQSYMQPVVAQAPSGYPFQQSSFQSNCLPPIQSYYEPIGAPILPPIRMQDYTSLDDSYRRNLQQEQRTQVAQQQSRQQQNEEKATGGVSAKLDYDLERMTDFVTEAAQHIIIHGTYTVPGFRKWVHQVLSATRLPSATILLSLHYLNDRMARFPESIASGELQLHRLLAVALVLGSKFLDDNTFINRSWSDVTSIKVSELNVLEMQWLDLINYELHIDPNVEGGLSTWLDAWKDYDAKITAKQQAARLSPIETNVHRHSSSRERYSPYPKQYSTTSSHSHAHGTPQSSRSSQCLGSTPFSASDPWGSQVLEDFYKRQNRYPTLEEIDMVNRRANEERARQATYAYPQSASSYYPQPSSNWGWGHNSWNAAHRYDCNCNACIYQHQYHAHPMSLASSYSAQTVMA